jgi:hypothetical protein
MGFVPSVAPQPALMGIDEFLCIKGLDVEGLLELLHGEIRNATTSTARNRPRKNALADRSV